jgi:hypothetical protein
MNPAFQGTTPPPAATAPQIAGESFEALQAQFIAQSQQLAVLQAQRRVLDGVGERRTAGKRRINVSSDAGAEGLLAQRTVLDNQILKLQMDLAGTRAQLASRMGVPGERLGPNGRYMGQAPFDFARRGPDPDVIVGMSFTVAIAVAFPLAIAYARRIWRGKPSASAQTGEITPRLDRLEQAVDAIAIEIERVAEGQRFVTKVLAERPVQGQTHVAAESPLARDAASVLGEGKPFLALGAGPIESIRVAERQGVRQSITPH